MNRWLIEKSGTGIEKSGTGIEKSGTGIEKSGTGIEKSGTGIEKSGTGLSRSLCVLAIVLVAFTSQISAAVRNDPAGNLQIVVNGDSMAVSWIIDSSVFSGVSSLRGSFANLSLTEVSIAQPTEVDLRVVGGGTGKDVVGGGTGKDVVGGGTGVNVVGGGTGINVVGGGTGANVVGGGTGSDSSNLPISNRLVVGGGTGADAIIITLPDGTDMQMEVSLGCNVANVSILDSNFAEVVSFNNVPVFGASSFCSSPSPGFGRVRDIAYAEPIRDTR